MLCSVYLSIYRLNVEVQNGKSCAVYKQVTLRCHFHSYVYIKKKNSIRFLVRFYDYGLPDCWLYPQAVYSFNSAQNTIPGILNMTEQLQQTELTNI